MINSLIRAPTGFVQAAVVVGTVLALAGCGPGRDAGSGGWAGTIDTLASGQVVVSNPATPSWAPDEAWTVVEQLRIGSLDGEGPDLFGNVRSFAVDDRGWIWILEGQAQEVRVFSADGEYIRTVGRRGGGPGEFSGAVHIDRAPDGTLWVMDPQNNRMSIFDTAGVYLEGKQAPGGFMILPWPGGFDREGRYSAPAPRVGTAGPFSLDHVRHDAELTPLDTLRPPVDPITRDRFTIEEDGLTRVAAAVPFAGGMSSRLAPSGHFWSLLIDTYRLTEFDDQGDTLRTITRAFEPIRVSGEEREQALEGLEWFTNQGGRIDPSKIPTTRSLAQGFVFDEMDHIWVATTPEGREAGWVYDIFTPEGRYLGPIELPFQLRQSPPPVFRDGTMYAVTTDALDVQQLVVATIRR